MAALLSVQKKTRENKCLPVATDAKSSYKRDSAVAREFEKHHLCCSTAKTYGRCPGYVKDHVTPLCAGGADSTSNM